MQAVASGKPDSLRDVLASVTPGGGKSLLPVITSARLTTEGTVECVVGVVGTVSRDRQRLRTEVDSLSIFGADRPS